MHVQDTAEKLANGTHLMAAGSDGKLRPVRLSMSDWTYFANRQDSLDDATI